MTKKLYFLILIIALLPLGCSGKDKIKPSDDSLITQDALQKIKLIEEAYEKKDLISIHSNAELNLSEKIVDNLLFDSADISFSYPRLVKINDTDLTITQNWQGQWIINGTLATNRGVSKLIFQKNTMKLVRIDGDNPFLVPSANR